MALKNYTQFLNETLTLSTDWVMENVLNEGGAYGHISHPFEDIGLTMADLQDMIQSTVSGAFGPENFVMEKCVSGDTLVKLEKHGTLTIKELVDNQYEDNVLSLDSFDQPIFLPIVNWFDNGLTEDWIEIETEDGHILRVTPNHRIFANGVDVKAEDLQIGDSLSTFLFNPTGIL